MARDFYDVLGVDRSASETDIKKAYRRLAMEHHPDRNAGDESAEERFKEVTEAYEVLGSAEQRARYDRYGMAGLKGGQAGQAGFGGFHHVDLSEALSMFMREFGGMGGFDAFFGGGRRARQQQKRGQDIRAKVRVRCSGSSYRWRPVPPARRRAPWWSIRARSATATAACAGSAT